MKELIILIKLLFKSKPADIKEVELLGMNNFPFKGYKYLMWCGKVIYRNDMIEKRKKEWETPSFLISKNHETIHLNQAKKVEAGLNIIGNTSKNGLKEELLWLL